MPTTPNFSQPAIFSEVSTPTAPDSGYLKVYGKAGALCSIANGGSEKAYVTSTDLSAYLPLAGGTLVGDLKFTDATYDIGKSGATRPRDLFASRDITFGGQLKAPAGSQYAASIQNSLFGTGTGINFTAAGTFFIDNNSAVVQVGVGGQNKLVLGCDLRFASSIGATEDLYVVRSAADTLALRRSTNAQAFQIHETYTSSTSFGTLQIKANAGAAYQIGSAVGSAGGTNRAIDFGHWNSAGTFTSALSIASTGAATFASTINTMDFATGNYNLGVGYSTNVSLGFAATALGWTARATHNYAISIGASAASAAANQFTVGDSTNVSKFRFGTGVASVTFDNPLILGQLVYTSGSPTAFTITGAAHTTLTASTEATDVNFNLARTVQFATGALTTQRAMRIQAPTYSFVGASTITTASTLSISGAPVAGTNATITNAYALNVESGKSFFGGNIVLTAFGVNAEISSLGGNITTANNFSATGGLSWGSGWGSLGGGNTGLTLSQVAGGSGGIVISPGNSAFVHFRSGTTSQAVSVYNTYTSSTSYETLNIKGKASANFEIGPENGSAGGTLRGLTIGGYSAGSTTITPWLSFTSSGTPTFDQGTVVIPSGGTGLMCQQTNIYLDSYGTHSGIRYRRSEGTQGSPTGVAFNSLVGFVATYGYHTGSAYHSTKGASIDFYATEAYTSGAQGTKIVFGTTPNGTTTNTVALTIDQNQVATFSKLVAQSAAEITSTPSGTTQTITLNNGNHQTLTLTSSTGAVTATLTVPSNVSSGTIIVKQHGTTPRNITWAVSAGTIKWMGTQPTWSSDAANDIRIVSWRYDGSVMYLMSTDKAA